MTIEHIYWHWSATPYDWAASGHYHDIFAGDTGHLTECTPHDTPLYEATYGRNTNALALAIACMSPENGTWGHPPQEPAIDAMCKRTAQIAINRSWGVQEMIRRCMTHAEAAANRDYPRELVARFSNKSPSSNWDHLAQSAGLPHANYGPSSWPDGWPGGDVVRWDFYQLREQDKPGTGGHELRTRTAAWMAKLAKK